MFSFRDMCLRPTEYPAAASVGLICSGLTPGFIAGCAGAPNPVPAIVALTSSFMFLGGMAGCSFVNSSQNTEREIVDITNSNQNKPLVSYFTF